MPMLATPCCLELGEVSVALLIWEYSRAGATCSTTESFVALGPRQGLVVSKAVHIPIQMRRVSFATLLPMLPPWLDNRRPKAGYSQARRVWSRCSWFNQARLRTHTQSLDRKVLKSRLDYA
jgi:hypothetical protein